MNLIEVARMTEDQARAYLESIRWPDGPICLHCGSKNVSHLEGKKHRKGVIQCNDCDQQFSVTVNSIMESSHIPLNKWVLAFHLMCSSKKGISALQLQRELGLGSYRTAWFMCHRIRHAMDHGPMAEMLKGTVEVDETYVGGKSRKGIRGRGSERKTPVVALMERGGRVRSKPVERIDAKTLKGEIRKHVDPNSMIMTDELPSYRGIGKEFAGGHQVVSHSAGEYSRGEVHVNTDESYFALLKRGHYGIFHSFSKYHLHRYCHEFDFRWNSRDANDADRTALAIRQMSGKRLMYQKPR